MEPSNQPEGVIPTMEPSSQLEKLPLEITEDIFILSKNFNLPFVSKTLLFQLSQPQLPHRIASIILSSDDANLQNDLLRRRFLSLELFNSVTRSIIPPCTHEEPEACPLNFNPGYYPDEDVPHYVFADGIQLCERLLNKLHVDLSQPLPDPVTGKFWKINLMRRMLAGGLVIPNTASQSIIRATRRGLHEAVRARNRDAVRFFTIDPIELDVAVVVPHIETMRLAVIRQNCADFEIVYNLFRAYNVGAAAAIDDEQIRRWVDETVAEDMAAIRSGPAHYVRPVQVQWRDLWVASWVNTLAVGGRQTFKEFMEIRSGENGYDYRTLVHQEFADDLLRGLGQISINEG
ncbi:MAG: hypothetical protein M1829_001566 [Trizodia sp. TS-e1964]|nr:MAG: hypothetical protein M1829_001566 [Trizodia sp. TS-e1964]